MSESFDVSNPFPAMGEQAGLQQAYTPFTLGEGLQQALKRAEGAITTAAQSDAERAIDEAFPPVEPGIEPCGNRVLVQVRRPVTKTKGGVIFADESVETDKWNQQVAKVIALGPLAFRHRDTLEPWVEGLWARPGDFVRVPKYNGDRWEVPIKGEASALFVIFKDTEIIGRLTGDPLSIRAYL